jgi:hypothetical protein
MSKYLTDSSFPIFKKGQLVKINGESLTYCKMVKGSRVFKNSKGDAVRFTAKEFGNKSKSWSDVN